MSCRASRGSQAFCVYRSTMTRIRCRRWTCSCAACPSTEGRRFDLARVSDPAQCVDVYDELRVADGGDIAVVAQDLGSALAAITARAESITRSGAICGLI